MTALGVAWCCGDCARMELAGGPRTQLTLHSVQATEVTVKVRGMFMITLMAPVLSCGGL